MTTNGMEIIPGQGQDLVPGVESEVGAVSAIAREQSEIQAAIVVAKKYPRNEMSAFERVQKSFKRIGVAEAAQYCFKRGGATIKGPSAPAARELARCWGNLRYGIRIVSEGEDTMHIKGYAYDCESNSYVENEDKFKKLIQRKTPQGTVWVKPDERDLRELVFRRGAILVRNSILQLLPPDLIDDACALADKTLTERGSDAIKKDRTQVIKALVAAFSQHGVSVEMIEGRLGHKLEQLTPPEYTELLTIMRSLADGATQWTDHFDSAESTAASAKQSNLQDKVKDSLKNIRKTPASNSEVAASEPTVPPTQETT